MQTSIFLAKLLGPILALAGLAMLINRKELGALAQEFLRSRALFFLLGLVDFAVGLAIVLTHNVWAADWRVIITVLGWRRLAQGLCAPRGSARPACAAARSSALRGRRCAAGADLRSVRPLHGPRCDNRCRAGTSPYPHR